MREHKASIEVASAPEEGTRFRLIFPVAHTLKSSSVLQAVSQSEAEAVAVTKGAPVLEAK